MNDKVFASMQAPSSEAQAREQRAAEMESLTVSELTNLMKARNIPIGSRKRKIDLIEKLLVCGSTLRGPNFRQNQCLFRRLQI